MSNSYFIKDIVPIKNKKSRVCLEDKMDFVLYNSEIKKLGLNAGDEIELSEINRIYDEVLTPRAKKRAMHLLEKQDRSHENLREKLRENGYPDKSIEAAIEYVDSFGYVDDERMARSYVRYHQDSKSKLRIRMDLRGKGISDDIIDIVIDDEYTNDERDLIAALLIKKGYDENMATNAEKQKMYRFLAGRGFSSSDISEML